MTIMKNASPRSRASSGRKADSHARIVEVAARAIRRTGYDGTGVADIMKEAGLTHGGFYAHFASRDALLAEAADHAGAQTVATSAQIVSSVPPEQAAVALMQAYLSDGHLNNLESGCPIAALGSEMPRQAPAVRQAATRRIKEMIDLAARQFPDWGTPQAHERALVTVCALAGTLMLARAVDDPALSAAMRDAVLAHFGAAGVE
ncbi:TetR/AcrR family transcriptional regulator [Xanthomonas campestris]|uniref:TetR/AcrR family transcriptional regulator n=1 Tax=Xanthomonas campestris TaxID=339 RepID=UPI001CD6E886|nr:TetR/AcrR family transcriptional regulator [Xanthomonas campestris]MEB2185681.1 TetR/AcrR family transcriptional regulator [Xanthomonas campestris pv. campestris]